MITESLSRAQRDFDTFLEDKVDMDWEDQRRKIFQHFGLSQSDEPGAGGFGSTNRGAFGRSGRTTKAPGGSPGQGPAGSRRSVFGRSGLDKSVIGTPGTSLASRQIFEHPAERAEGHAAPSPDLRFLREKMDKYATKVEELNVTRLNGETSPLLHQFAEVESPSGGDVS